MSPCGKGNKSSRKESNQDGEDPFGCFGLDFIGGPYDGYQESYSTRPEYLAADVVWFVGPGMLNWLGEPGREAIEFPASGSLTSAALYELEVMNGRHRYRFVGSISVNELSVCLREEPC